MWIMTSGEFKNIRTLAEKLIVKEYAQLPDCMRDSIPFALQAET